MPQIAIHTGDPQHRRVCFLGGHQNESEAQYGQTDPAENASRIAPVDEPSRDRRGEADRHRPGGHQEAGLDRRSAEHLFEEERQRDESEVLRGERTDRAQNREREHRPGEEFERQHRVSQHALSPDEERTCDHRARQLERDRYGQPAKIVDADDQGAKSGRAQYGAEPIEPMTGERGPRQFTPRECQGDDAEGHINREQPLPRMKRSSAVLTLMMPAPPKPWRTREATSVVSEPDRAQASEPSVNTANPAMKTRR
jgi:hypothetical protein